MQIKIVIPLLNPGPELNQTVSSIIAQSNRDFEVLFSDNHSDRAGQNVIHAQAARLHHKGISTCYVNPNVKLGRVEHWNWAMKYPGTHWVKPLFSGDTMEPDFINELRHNIHFEAFFCSYLHHDLEGRVFAKTWKAPAFSLAGFLDAKLLPPCAMAFQTMAFCHAGGFDPAFPMYADSLLVNRMRKYNVAYSGKVLAGFHERAGRFSAKNKGKRAFEYVRFLMEVGL